MGNKKVEFQDFISPQVKKFFSEKKALVINPPKALRSSVKKVFFECGVSIHKIEFVEGSNEQIVSTIEEQRPELVLYSFEGGETDLLQVLEAHSSALPVRLGSGFFILSKDNSLVTASIGVEYDVDAVIAPPFTEDMIGKTILKSLKNKISPTPFYTRYSQLQGLIEKEKEKVNVDDVKPSITELSSLQGVKDDLVYYLKALCDIHQENYDLAIKNLDEGLKSNEKNYNLLKVMAETYVKQRKWREAYQAHKRILKHYPLTYNKIPELVKLSVVNQEIDDIFFYTDFFKEVDNPDIEIQKYIAAGLTMAGMFLLKNGEKEKGYEALNSATKYANGIFSITRVITLIFLENNRFGWAKKALYSTSEEFQRDDKFLTLELKVLNGLDQNSQNEALKKGYDLIRKNVKDVEVYEVLVKLSIKQGRKKAAIDDLIFQASKIDPAFNERMKLNR